MFKYFITLFSFSFAVSAQQTNTVYYAAPYLQIEDVQKKAVADANDFGYNILVHPKEHFVKEGFFMWVDDQWYEILNSKDLFIPYQDFKTLFTISKDNKNPLKIKDVNDVVYLFPIEALDSYIVSPSDFVTLSQTIQKQDLITYTKPAEVVAEKKPVVLDVIDVVEVPKKEAQTVIEKEGNTLVSTKEETTVTTELTKLNTNEQVLITSENPQSVLLDVMDVVEVVKREEIPFDPTQNTVVDNQPEIVAEKPKVEEQITEEVPVKIAAKNTLIIPNPSNDYEIAVNEGFDGTVTEWVEMIDAKGGKTAYQQAVDKGYKGTEEEWMKMLWGREVDVEIAKRDKTTAIVTEWIQSLKTSKGSSPYEMALKHGFYGTFTEWVESVIGTDGEKAYEHAKEKGFEGTYKEWIQKQLNQSNQEVLRKEQLSKTQMFVAPNVLMPLQATANEPLTFDLYDYYNQFYGAPMVSSAGENNNALEIKPTDLEYQITWFEKDKVKIIELTKEGVLKYQPLEGVLDTNTKLNVRYVLK
ncbi:hypothetical protein MG290_09940 [Flavobacterium sp. CBA20B-1]|uniref:hypothetical protein n=1 Tax=unclassified Flavobacterium TaxID=196869 RepID=UPI0022255422|nr:MULTISPECIES: hypothetical protein [unclassified Flavobacterium]WCM41276.1 hypothetical protein MG290_09940 [Flavobacterium sp. CBA20B-1]